MKTIFRIALIGLLFTGCSEKPASAPAEDPAKVFNQDLANELAEMARIDQMAVDMPRGKYKDYSREQWESFQDSVLRKQQRRLAEIFDKHGYPGYDLVGETGATNFWLMVQHSDFDPAFQERVVKEMKKEVDRGNADPSDYGYLVDRVNLNIGKPQVYGTQVAYNTKICQAYPRDLEDSVNVNQRRKEIGLEPLEEYLNSITTNHFEMNKEVYLKAGVTAPRLYQTDKAAK